MRSRPGFLTLLGVLGFSTLLSAVSLDPTFGGSGIVQAQLIGGAFAFALQPDGKIVVAGQSYDDGIALARFTDTGQLDPSFGVGGIITSFPASSALVNAMVLQQDGRILISGAAPAATGMGMLVARFLTNGDPDPSFGTGGLVTTFFPGRSAGASAIALQPDGKIVAAGGVYDTTPTLNGDFAAARYGGDGNLDPSFGSGGLATIDLGASLPESAAAVVVEPGGRIVLGGLSGSPSGTGFALVGLLTSGALDPSFGSSGSVFLPVGAYSECKSMALQRDGKIVAVGAVDPGGILAVRMHSDGSPDSTFGASGIATIQNVSANSVAVDYRGRIVMGGTDNNANYLLARLLPDGQPDATVGPHGWTSPGLGGNPPQEQAHASWVGVRADGAIVLGGYVSVPALAFAVLVRYAADAATIPMLSSLAALVSAIFLGVAGLLALRRLGFHV